jgi:DNA-binding NarL/FixJ family response regulator
MKFTNGARGGLPSLIGGEIGHSRELGNSVSIALIDRQPLTRPCLSLWLQDGSPDLHIVSVRSPVDLLDASRPLSDPHTIIFSLGAALVTDPDVLGKIILLRRHMSRVPLVLLSDRDGIDDIVEAMEQGVRGYIPTSLGPSEAAAALQCVAAGGPYVPASALIKFAQDRHDGAGPSIHETGAFERLTPRESEVLARLRQGKPNKVSRTNSRSPKAPSRCSSEAGCIEPHRGRKSDPWSGRCGRSRVFWTLPPSVDLRDPMEMVTALALIFDQRGGSERARRAPSGRRPS